MADESPDTFSVAPPLDQDCNWLAQSPAADGAALSAPAGPEPGATEPARWAMTPVDETRLTHIAAPGGVAPGMGYTHVVIGSGRLAALSGQGALDAQGEVVGAGDPAAQARQVFENLRRCLASAGATFGDVVKLNFYVTDVGYLPAIRVVRDEYTDTERPPASTAVQVAALFRPELMLEVEALALLPGD